MHIRPKNEDRLVPRQDVTLLPVLLKVTSHLLKLLKCMQNHELNAWLFWLRRVEILFPQTISLDKKEGCKLLWVRHMVVDKFKIILVGSSE